MDIDMQKPADDAAPGTVVTQTLPDGMTEIEVRVGPGGARTQSFVGRRLAKSQQVTAAGAENIRIYQSRKGKLVVHRHYLDWSDFSTATKHVYAETKDHFNARREEFVAARRNADGSHVPLIANWATEFKGWRDLVDVGQDGYGDYTLEIVDSLGELRDRVPAKAYRTVADAVENPSAQFLDI